MHYGLLKVFESQSFLFYHLGTALLSGHLGTSLVLGYTGTQFIVSGLIYMILALHEAAKLWRITAGLKGSRLLKALVRDQVVYFLACVILSVSTDQSTLTTVCLALYGSASRS